ncbi:nucleoside hydrolase [Phaeobacter sp. B1627]|uniref:nucleoside hydrolase n=1 Tax=Phaeobacter sp. B1627 TaxID=2583809 RepID=UPI00111841A3|nr:nucleoside hydrolase [Phaeobacter sp. B1627]TNJ40605.1 nucleoside hydrolase [Phaeobacter sp. B1627]
MRPVIIDTDPGIDDAIAILFALNHPGLEVLTLTTVAGNIGLDRTTWNAGRLAAFMGRDVPVHPGAARPLRSDAINEERIHGDDGLGGVAFPAPRIPASDVGATEAMADLLDRHPERSITVLTLGPLTNLAQLITQAPQAASRIGAVVSMGGAVHEPGNVGDRAEFNIVWDAHAADIVFRAGLDLTLVPLDTTRKFRADKAYLAALRRTGQKAAIASADLIAAYQDQKNMAGHSRPLHDPCVPMLITAPGVFDVQQMNLSVDTETGAIRSGECPLKVSMGLDAEAARQVLLRGLS